MTINKNWDKDIPSKYLKFCSCEICQDKWARLLHNGKYKCYDCKLNDDIRKTNVMQ